MLLFELKEEMRKEKQISIHHLLPKSRGGSNHDINKKVLKEGYHRALHTLHGNATPYEQLLNVLDLNKGILTEQFKSELLETLLRLKEEDIYVQASMKREPIETISRELWKELF